MHVDGYLFMDLSIAANPIRVYTLPNIITPDEFIRISCIAIRSMQSSINPRKDSYAYDREG
jgi:hypothetical protein